MTRPERRFITILAVIVVGQGLAFGISKLLDHQEGEAGSRDLRRISTAESQNLQFPPPEMESVTFGPPGYASTILRFPANASVTDFPMLDVPQHVPEDGVLPPTRRERTFSYKTNSAGVRGTREFSPEPGEGVYRIGVLGTGVTFGLGVNDDEVLTARLQAQLDLKPHKDLKFEVLNFGRPGLCLLEATLYLKYWSSLFRCDLWVIMMGVNDSLPCFNVSLNMYAASWRSLLVHLDTLSSKVVVAIEPVNTFYPWLHLYKNFDRVMRRLVGTRYPLIDLSSYLDGYERESGLRLEVAGDKVQVVRYEGGTPHVEFETDKPASNATTPSVPTEVFEYLDGSDLELQTFITDVHLNESGHEAVARALYDVVGSILSGVAPHVPSCPDCRVVEPGL